MSTEENKEKYITIMNNLTCSLGTYTGEFGKMKSYAYGKYAAQGEGTWLARMVLITKELGMMTVFMVMVF